MSSLIGKARKPKFELHLKIFDLNNIPLASGNSFIKWHLSHSMHAEHRGRTGKCPIADHKVDFGFCKLIQGIRISIDKNNSLAECLIEFEVLQEFAIAEKITLGCVKLNLSEYIEESEAFGREIGSPPRKRSSLGLSPTGAVGDEESEARIVEEGIVRRYLMQDSKINSTLKIGILMVQVDGERNFIAPALKTAPVFGGGIAGLVGTDPTEDDTGPIPTISKPRDAAEVQDLYRRTLAASWSRQPSELPADECIEDIFSGGNGWRTKREAQAAHQSEEDEVDNFGTLRPSDFRRFAASQNSHQHHHRRHSGNSNTNGHQSHHRRTHSASSDRSASTVTGGGTPSRLRRGGGGNGAGRPQHDESREPRDEDIGNSGRSGSLGSLVPGLGSSSSDGGGRSTELGMRPVREVDELEVRDNMVAWKLSSGVAV